EAGRDERRPAGLVAGATAAAVVAVEVLVEEHVVAPVRIVGPAAVVAVAGTASAAVGEEERAETALQLACDDVERDAVTRAGRQLDGEALAVEVVVALERLDDEEVQREPHGAAPVRVAAEHPRVRLAR